MRIAIIPPIPDLERFENASRLHMMLAHLAENDTYRGFYKDASFRGGTVILDNGACENDLPLPMSRLLEIAREVRAREVVIPDVQFETWETLAALAETIDFLGGEGRSLWDEAGQPSLMFVPQGRNISEWCECFTRGWRLLYEKWGQEPTVAVAKQYEPMSPGGRVDFVRFLRGAGVSGVHLLGWSPPWDSLERTASAHPWIRSIDSAKPLSYAKHGVKLELGVDIERIPREEDYFATRVPQENEHLAWVNIETFRRAATAWSNRAPV